MESHQCLEFAGTSNSKSWQAFVERFYNKKPHPLCNRRIGRVVKAVDSKSTGCCPRRFESCMRRYLFCLLFAWNFVGCFVCVVLLTTHNSQQLVVAMVKNKKRSGDGRDNARPKKKHLTAHFWIDACRDTNPEKGKAKMTVLITQVDLTDDHRHVSRDKDDSIVEGLTKEPTVTTSLQTENDSVSIDVTIEEPKNHDANAETPNETKSPENSKQVDYKHAFISVKRKPSASPHKRKVS